MLIENQIADVQMHIDTIHAYAPIELAIGLIFLIMAILFGIGLVIELRKYSIFDDNDPLLNDEKLFGGLIISIILCAIFLSTWYMSVYIDLPLLETQLENLKSLNVWYG
ncbi:MAG: hypothetical protein WCS17_03440 [Prevotella sp.]